MLELNLLTFYTLSLATGAFLWLGLYLITRTLSFPLLSTARVAFWGQPAFPSGLAMVLAAWAMFGEAMRIMAQNVEEFVFWQKVTIWATPLAVALWFVACYLYCKPESKPMPSRLLDKWLVRGLMIVALFFGLATIFTDILFYYEQVFSTGIYSNDYFIPVNLRGYLPFGTFMVGIPLACTALLFYRANQCAKDSSLRHAFNVLALGNAMITLGLMSQLAGKNIMEERLQIQLGTLIIAAGLFMIGFSIFKYDALFKESINKDEFKRLLFRTLITSLIYVLMARLFFWLSGEEMYRLITPLLIVLVVLTIVPEPWTQKVLDRVMQRNGKDERQKAVSKSLTTPPAIAPPVVVVAPEPVDEEQITKLRDMSCSQIQTIFKYKNFHKDEIMANSELFTLRLVQQAQEAFMAQNDLAHSTMLSTGEKARLLRTFLTQYISHKLCPAPEQAPPKPPSDEWIEYLILTKSYLEGLTRKEVIDEIFRECGIKLSNGRVYNKHLQNGRQRLAEMLWRDEVRAE